MPWTGAGHPVSEFLLRTQSERPLAWVLHRRATIRRYGHLTRGQVYIYIGALNAPWVLFGLLGLYVSVRLILDGDYGVPGY